MALNAPRQDFAVAAARSLRLEAFLSLHPEKPLTLIDERLRPSKF